MRWLDDRIADGGKASRQFRALVSDIWNCDDLPERGAGEGADREQPPRRDSIPVDDRTIIRNVEPDLQGVSPRQALLEQALYRRIARGPWVLHDAGAVDDHADLQIDALAPPAPA